MKSLKELIALWGAMNLQQLRAARIELCKEADAATDAAVAAATTAGRALNAEEEAGQKGYTEKVAALDGLIRFAQAKVERTSGMPAAAVLDAGETGKPAPTAPKGNKRLGATRGVEFTGVPNVAQDPMQGFRNFGEFAEVVKGACDNARFGGGVPVDERLLAAPSNFHQESGSAEGAMVPAALREGIWSLVFDDPLMALLTIEPTEKPAVDIIKDETTPWGATGVQAKWRSEGGILDASKLDTKNGQCRVHDLYAFVLAQDELLEDAPRLNDRLSVKVPEAIRWKLIEAFMFGDGVGKPLGWAHASNAAAVAVARTTAAQIKPEDVTAVYSRLLVQDGRDASFWVGNRDIIPELILRSVVGNVPVWMPPTGLAGAPNGTILGRPLFFSEHAQTKGTRGDLQLINPDGYYAVQRGSARNDSSIHLFFDYFVTAFRSMVRFGGQPFLSGAVAPAKGSATKSHFVMIAT